MIPNPGNVKGIARIAIKVLANSKIPLRVKKWVVSQKGDFLGTLASLAISLVKAFAVMKCCKKIVLVPEDQCSLLLKAHVQDIPPVVKKSV